MAKKFKLEIEMENAEMQTPQDVAKALHMTAAQIDQQGRLTGRILDINGNAVGHWKFIGGNACGGER